MPALTSSAHDALVHQPAEHHLGDIEAGFVGHAQSLDALLGNPQLCPQLGHGLAAAVHDHREVPLGDHGLHGLDQPKQK